MGWCSLLFDRGILLSLLVCLGNSRDSTARCRVQVISRFSLFFMCLRSSTDHSLGFLYYMYTVKRCSFSFAFFEIYFSIVDDDKIVCCLCMTSIRLCSRANRSAKFPLLAHKSNICAWELSLFVPRERESICQWHGAGNIAPFFSSFRPIHLCCYEISYFMNTWTCTRNHKNIVCVKVEADVRKISILWVNIYSSKSTSHNHTTEWTLFYSFLSLLERIFVFL